MKIIKKIALATIALIVVLVLLAACFLVFVFYGGSTPKDNNVIEEMVTRGG